MLEVVSHQQLGLGITWFLAILSRYFAHDNDNIMIQRFCDNRHIARNFIHHTSRYLSLKKFRIY